MRLVLILVLLAAGCGPRKEEAEVRGSVAAADGKTGVTCYVEINSMAAFLIPESVEVKTGAGFKRAMTTSGVMRNMYAAVRCEGYATRLSPMFELEAGKKVDLGKLVVSRE